MRRSWILLLLAGLLASAAALAESRAHTGPWREAGARVAPPNHKPSAAASALFGDRHIEARPKSDRPGQAEAFPFANRTTGTAQTLHVYVSARNRAHRLIAGLYSSNKRRPGSLLASGSVSPSKGKWNVVTLHFRSSHRGSHVVHAGTIYWVALLGKGGSLAVRARTTNLCRGATSAQRSLKLLPRAWKTARTRAGCPISAYVAGIAPSRRGTGSPGAPKPAPPTPPKPVPPAPAAPTIHCDLNATPSTFGSQVSNAAAGQTLCLSAGDYGTWTGTGKAITIAPQPGASPRMSFDFGSNAANFSINGGHSNLNSNTPGINIRSSSFGAGSKNITLENVAATDDNAFFVLDIRTDGPGIVIKSNVFHDMDYPNTTTGAIRILNSGGAPASNVLIEDNLFRDMGADGIDPASPATIVSNDFSNVESGSEDPRHTDVIQIFGQNGVIIAGNFVHNGCSQGIDAFDGTANNAIEDNVIVGCTVHSLVTAGDTPGSTVTHNTVVGDPNGSLIECGSKSGEGPSTTKILDNISQSGVNSAGVPCQPAANVDNMFFPGHSTTNFGGSGNFTGVPQFVGGATPTTYAGYALAAGSAGIGRADDGSNVGARVNLYSTP